MHIFKQNQLHVDTKNLNVLRLSAFTLQLLLQKCRLKMFLIVKHVFLAFGFEKVIILK